jgi:hypothetical protein
LATIFPNILRADTGEVVDYSDAAQVAAAYDGGGEGVEVGLNPDCALESLAALDTPVESEECCGYVALVDAYARVLKDSWRVASDGTMVLKGFVERFDELANIEEEA